MKATPGRQSTRSVLMTLLFQFFAWLLIPVALLLAGCSGPETVTYDFQLKEPPAQLNKELALDTARQAMAKAGFDLQRWGVKAGTTFEQFGQTNCGRVHFTDGTSSRCVQVRLAGDRVSCEVVQLP